MLGSHRPKSLRLIYLQTKSTCFMSATVNKLYEISSVNWKITYFLRNVCIVTIPTHAVSVILSVLAIWKFSAAAIAILY